MSILGVALYWALNLYFYVLIARLILDLARQANPQWRPKKAVMAGATVVYALTDAPLKAVRKVIKPLRFGGIMLDFAWTILLVAVMFLRGLTSLL